MPREKKRQERDAVISVIQEDSADSANVKISLY